MGQCCPMSPCLVYWDLQEHWQAFIPFLQLVLSPIESSKFPQKGGAAVVVVVVVIVVVVVVVVASVSGDAAAGGKGLSEAVVLVSLLLPVMKVMGISRLLVSLHSYTTMSSKMLENLRWGTYTHFPHWLLYIYIYIYIVSDTSLVCWVALCAYCKVAAFQILRQLREETASMRGSQMQVFPINSFLWKLTCTAY